MPKAWLHCRWSAGPGAVLEGVGLREPDLFGNGEGFFEFYLRLAWEAHDDVGRKCNPGLHGANAGDEIKILLSGVLSIHGCENAIGAGLDRQVQLRHQRRQIAMCGDQVVVHIARMAGGITQPLHPDIDEAFKKPRQRPSAAVRAFTSQGLRWGGLWSNPDYQHFDR